MSAIPSCSGRCNRSTMVNVCDDSVVRDEEENDTAAEEPPNRSRSARHTTCYGEESDLLKTGEAARQWQTAVNRLSRRQAWRCGGIGWSGRDGKGRGRVRSEPMGVWTTIASGCSSRQPGRVSGLRKGNAFPPRACHGVDHRRQAAQDAGRQGLAARFRRGKCLRRCRNARGGGDRRSGTPHPSSSRDTDWKPTLRTRPSRLAQPYRERRHPSPAGGAGSGRLD